MKNIFVATICLVFTQFAQAGDNGAYTQCRSASGRTILTMGTVGSADAPQTVELKIDNATYGAVEIDNEVILSVHENGTLLKFTEADHEATDWVTVRMNSEGTKGRILSGLDPRTGKPLTIKINLTCAVIYNKI